MESLWAATVCLRPHHLVEGWNLYGLLWSAEAAPGLVNAYAYAHASEKILNASQMRMRQ